MLFNAGVEADLCFKRALLDFCDVFTVYFTIVFLDFM